MKCQAVTHTKYLYQQEWIKTCENQALAVHNGYHLCGTPINQRGELRVLVRTTEEERVDNAA